MAINRPLHTVEGFKVVELSPLADPDKGEQYILEQYAKLPKEDVDREFRLLPVGQVDAYPVFGDYQRKLHEDPTLVYRTGLRYIYRGWDFGKVHPCVEFLQPDGQKINIIYEVYGTNIQLDHFAGKVIAESGINFPGATFVDWVDASGVNTPQSGEGRTCVKILMDMGLRPRYRREDVEIGIEKMAKNLTQWVDGRPILQLNPIRCPHLAASMRGGYKRNPKGVIIKDGVNDHAPDSARYAHQGLMVNITAQFPVKRDKPKSDRPLTDSELFSRYGRI